MSNENDILSHNSSPTRMSNRENWGIVTLYLVFVCSVHLLGHYTVILPILEKSTYSTLSMTTTIIVLYALALISAYFYVRVVFSNPGIITSSENNISNSTKTKKIFPYDAVTKEFMEGEKENGNNVLTEECNIRFCYTCLHIKAPRSKHCHECDVCIECHDHHCVFVNNCIGLNNHRLFLLYVTAQVLHLTLSAVLCAHCLFQLPYPISYRSSSHMNTLSTHMSSAHVPTVFVNGLITIPATAALLLISCLLDFLLMYLLGSLVYDISRNQLVNEVNNGDRYAYYKKGNPFDKGFIENWSVFWGQKRRAQVQELLKMD